jgi:small subunit ribosomal protein S21
MSVEGVNDVSTPEKKEAPAKEGWDSYSDAPRRDSNSAGASETAHGEHEAERKKKRRASIGEVVFCRPLEVNVRDDRVDQAIRQLKNRMAREGVLRELKNRRHYFKPSELKRIKRREAARRRRKQVRQKNSR